VGGMVPVICTASQGRPVTRFVEAGIHIIRPERDPRPDQYL
jgi:hypothetical protein